MADSTAMDPEKLDWDLARGMIEEFLPRSAWGEEVLSVEKGEPGRIALWPDGRRRFLFPGCALRVRRARDGREFDRRYSFAFDWAEGRWMLIDLPAVR
jgi:hypothetical protein